MTETIVVHCKAAEFDEYIGRDRRDGELHHMNNTPVGERGWIGNPYLKEDHGRQRCIELFEQDFLDRINTDGEFREAVEALEGQTLGCWCKPKDCHGDVLAEWIDSDQSTLDGF